MTRPNLYITGTKRLARPESRCTIFCDGSADSTFRPDIDLELSHWVPNRTPKEFKADTSTAICMKYVATGSDAYDLVVNTHADVDGVLATFTLLYPRIALQQRDAFVSAAEMGDFWGWAARPGQVLFQKLTQRIDALEETGADLQSIYEFCFADVNTLITQDFTDAEVELTLEPLSRSVDWIESGAVARLEHHDRFVQYTIPEPLSRNHLERALSIPGFNTAISDACLIWPQARARRDRDKVQLVSTETPEGWYHDVWYPGYMWAETPDSWRAPGLESRGEANGAGFSNPALEAAAARLQKRERHPVEWTVATQLSLSSSVPGRGYPVVLSTISRGKPAVSSTSPDDARDRLADVFAA